MRFIKTSWAYLLISAALLIAASAPAHAAPGYGTDNLALGRPVTPLTNTVFGSPSNVTDGDPDTIWYSFQRASGSGLSIASPYGYAYVNQFTVDLGAVSSIGKIDVWAVQANGFKISSSEDGVTWIPRHNYDWTLSSGHWYGGGGGPLTVPVDGAYRARYFKYEAAANWAQYVGILEFRVYEWLDAAPPPPDLGGLENVAKGKPVVGMWGTTVPGHGPGLITDGDLGSYWQGDFASDHCAAVACETGTWFTTYGWSYIDLGSSQGVQALRLHFPAPSMAPGIHSVWVFLSDSPTGSPKKWWGMWGDPSMAATGGTANDFPFVTSSDTRTFFLTAPVEARYVFVRAVTLFTRGPRLPGVAEVEVFGPLPVIKTHTITASADPNGNISPSGAVTVTEGDSKAFTIEASPGFHILDVLVDLASVGAVGNYTFAAVAADHTIRAMFAPDIFKITASAGSNGSINPSGTVMVTSGTSQGFSIAAAAGYHIADVLVDGTSVGAVGSYTFPAVVANHAISATFEIDAPALLFGGLMPPYAPPPATFKVGRAIPLKWQYTDARGRVVSSANASPVVHYQPAQCGATVGGAAVRINSPGESGLTYEAATGTWHVNWKTTGVPAGCYLLLVTSPTAQASGPIPIKLVK